MKNIISLVLLTIIPVVSISCASLTGTNLATNGEFVVEEKSCSGRKFSGVWVSRENNSGIAIRGKVSHTISHSMGAVNIELLSPDGAEVRQKTRAAYFLVRKSHPTYESEYVAHIAGLPEKGSIIRVSCP